MKKIYNIKTQLCPVSLTLPDKLLIYCITVQIFFYAYSNFLKNSIILQVQFYNLFSHQNLLGLTLCQCILIYLIKMYVLQGGLKKLPHLPGCLIFFLYLRKLFKILPCIHKSLMLSAKDSRIVLNYQFKDCSQEQSFKHQSLRAFRIRITTFFGSVEKF